MRLWAQLLSGIKRHMDKRRFELVTFVAAHELRSTLCSLAHGKVLTEFLSLQDVQMVARGEAPESLTAAEAVMVVFARKVARDASSVTSSDIQLLKQHGFTDAEIFDIVATAAARAFFSTVVESLGVEADAPLRAMDGEFSKVLAAGRPVEFADSAATATSRQNQAVVQGSP
jgi:alkylhydroperoxidase family enzyme